jgi:hypothetical protein
MVSPRFSIAPKVWALVKPCIARVEVERKATVMSEVYILRYCTVTTEV